MKKNLKYALVLILFLSNFLLFGYEDFFESDSAFDWSIGRIDSKISLDVVKSGVRLPSERTASSQLINKYLPSLLKNSYLSIVVDSSHRLGNYLANGEISLADLNSIIENGSKSAPNFTQDLKSAVVFHGVYTHEIAKLLIAHENSYTPSVPLLSSVSKTYTGLLIDARGLLPVHGEYTNERLEPCIFPKIWNSDMSLVYEKNMMNPKAAKERSIAVYSDTLDENAYRNIIGTQPLRIIARGVFGQNRTDPIISQEDSAKILSCPDNMHILNEGKIVILCDTQSLRARHKTNLPDENYYFAYRDIENILDGKRQPKVELSGKGKTIKIIMYDIRFLADLPNILPEEQGRMDVIAEALMKAAKNTRFLIEGHTADLKRPDDQLNLSIQRAKTVADELIKRGIAADRIDTAGYGSTKPLAPSDTSENRAKNRRVEITIIRN